MPKSKRVGRTPGVGINMDLLRQLKAGEARSCIFNVTRLKMESIRNSAHHMGMKIIIRGLDNGNYSIWRR